MNLNYLGEIQRLVTQTRRGTDNLRLYLATATLPKMLHGANAPPMPSVHQSAHRNLLTVRPERYRQLETIHSITDEAFDRETKKFLDDKIPAEALNIEDDDEDTGESLTIPCPGFNIRKPSAKGKPSEIHKVCRYVEEFPCETLQRIIHIAIPESQTWNFSERREMDVDDEIVRFHTWSSMDPRDDGLPRPILTMFIQPPWIAAPRDLVRFTQATTFPRCDRNGRTTRPFHEKEMMWAKLYDACCSRNSHWFVVTNYHGWVFGAFSKGWTKAFVSSVKSFDQTDPTVLEHLVYWLASTMEEEGGWTIPEVPEPVRNLGLDFTRSMPPPPRYRLPYYVSSESDDIENNENDMPDSASVSSDDDDTPFTPASRSPTPFPVAVTDHKGWDRTEELFANIQGWRKAARHDPNGDRVVPQDPPESFNFHIPAPPPSNLTVSTSSSSSTIRDYTFKEVERDGDFVNPERAQLDIPRLDVDI